MVTLPTISSKHRWRIVTAAGLALILALSAWAFNPRATTLIDSYASCAAAGYPVQDSDPPACSDGRHTFVGPAATVAPPAPMAANQNFEILVEGDSGGSYPKAQEVIAGPTGWARYWGRVHAGLASLPPILPVDFTTSGVVALSEGRQLTTGYNLKVTSITTTSAGTTVYVTESIPTITCTVAQTATNRYFIARTPVLPEPVSFRITTEHRHC